MTRPRNSSGPHRRPRSSKPPSAPVEELHPVAEPPDIATFREWNLTPEVQEVIEGMGIVEPTPIQRLTIQAVLDGRDVIAKAETGTGKTLAFGAPMMSRIESARATILGLVLCPTRELAQQVHQVLAQLGAPRGVRCALVVGGDPMHPQVDELRAGAQVVVGTPGRVLDLMGQRFLSFPWTEFAVLDEADEMLEIGFLDDVKKILAACPEERQTLLFSATFPPELLRLAREHTKNPVEVATARGVVTVEGIEHAFLRVDEDDRASALKRLIASTGDDDILLVFCDRRVDVERLMRSLERTRWSVKALHGGYDQAARFRVMSAFRAQEVKVLVATDVASRGLDITHVTHVVNFSVPREITDYTHRSGRTARAGRRGSAITLVAPSEDRRWNSVKRHMTWAVRELEAAWQVGDMGAAPQNGADPRKTVVEPERERRPEGRDAGARKERSTADGRRGRGRRGEESGPEPVRTPEPRTDAREDRRGTPAERNEAPTRSRARAQDSEPRAEPTPDVGERSRRSERGDGRRAEPTRASSPARGTRSRPSTRPAESAPAEGRRVRRPARDEADGSRSPRRETEPTRSSRGRRGEPQSAEAPKDASTAEEREPARPRRSRREHGEAQTTETTARSRSSERPARERRKHGTRSAADEGGSKGGEREKSRSRRPESPSKPSADGFGAGI